MKIPEGKRARTPELMPGHWVYCLLDPLLFATMAERKLERAGFPMGNSGQALRSSAKRLAQLPRSCRPARLAMFALLSLFMLSQPALASSPETTAHKPAVKTTAGYTVARYRYHTAECRYLQNPAMGIMLVATKFSLAMPTVSSLVSCMEPGYLQWT